VLLGALIVGAVAEPLVAIVGGVGGLALVALNAWLRRIEVAHIGFVLREHDLTLHRGVIGRSTATVPFARVQHVSIERGPLDRRYDLAALQLRTAGGSITIPGLRNETAAAMKQLVAERATLLAENEVDDTSAVHDIGGIVEDPFEGPPTGRRIDT
jgi:membrane protein YdbS with pleckstrin-like domain